MKRSAKVIGLSFILLFMIATRCFFLCWRSAKLSPQSNPWRASTIGEIPTPRGFSRVDTPKGSYAEYLRQLPLKPRGSKVQLYTGGDARLQYLSAAVVDLPLLSNYEQCADATMRLRAEYLFKNGRWSDICFKDVNGNRLRFQGGSRKAFETYLRKVYGTCSTFSLYRETKPRKITEVQPGDVLVYPARKGHKYGHAIMVADVARNRSGKVAIMCVEGNTPAREIHVVRNNLKPWINPWVILKGDEDVIHVAPFHFNAEELRHY